MIAERRELQMQVMNGGSADIRKQFNRMNRDLKKRIKQDKLSYLEEKFNEGDSRNIWRTANEVIGTVKNLSPTNILHKESEDSIPEMVKDPEKIATIFNDFFRKKVTKLREEYEEESSATPS